MRDFDFWALNEKIIFLNHGSFGACPRAVLEKQFEIKRYIESNPTRFYLFEHFERLDHVREVLGRFLRADPEGIVFTPNATYAVNAALLSEPLSEGDEILVTDHAYEACVNAARFIARKKRASLRIAHIPFPIHSHKQISDAIFEAVTPKTRLALIDHVSSPTALIFPLREISSRLQQQGISVLVDGAHGPGMLDIDLSSLDLSYYVGTCHKWICAPKGAAFLYVREDLRQKVHCPIMGFGLSWPEVRASRFKNLFDWPGTFDPSPILAVPEAIHCLGRKLPGGWQEIRLHNTNLIRKAVHILCEHLQIEPPCPSDLWGAMATLILPLKKTDMIQTHWLVSPLGEKLSKEYGIEVAVPPWSGENVLLRISAQLYNDIEDYTILARALKEIIGKRKGLL